MFHRSDFLCGNLLILVLFAALKSIAFAMLDSVLWGSLKSRLTYGYPA